MSKVILAAVLLIAALGLLGCGSQPAATASKVTVAGGTYTNVPPTQLKQMMAAKGFLLVNVHIPYAGELAQTDAFIPYNEIDQNLSRLPSDKNAQVVLYCSSGRMSGIAAEKLVELGYTNIWNLEGGMVAWQSAGYPLIQKDR